MTDPNAGGGGSGAQPAAVDDTGTAVSGGNVVIDVLANDQNLDDAPIAVSLASDPGNGSAFVLADNRISYTAESDFVGIDSFIYPVVDADGDNSNAVVRITVVAQNTGGTGTNQNNPASSGGGAFGPVALILLLSAIARRRQPG